MATADLKDRNEETPAYEAARLDEFLRITSERLNTDLDQLASALEK